jgi:hypothetical protein
MVCEIPADHGGVGDGLNHGAGTHGGRGVGGSVKRSRRAGRRCDRASAPQTILCVSGVYFLNETPLASIAGTSTLRVDGPTPCRDFNSDLETVAKSSSL